MLEGRDNEKNIYLIVALCVFFSCGPKSERVEKVMEDGVEIVYSPKRKMP